MVCIVGIVFCIVCMVWHWVLYGIGYGRCYGMGSATVLYVLCYI